MPLYEPDTVFTVTKLTLLIRDILEGTFSNITLEAEISNYRPNASGHLYFNLKDEGALISAVMFRGRASTLKFAPKDGMKVRCAGSISVYAPRGNYQFMITKMEIAGQGDILRILEERKQRLAQEGLFNTERKKEIPRFSKTIGIVTSPTGAALRDVLQITKRRNPGMNVVILPALVQGDGAAETIARQVQVANEFNLCDVLIVGRGGGSLEDLLPFSEEVVVRAVANSHIPTISAVGHEIDWSICDYAADLRAPTPSAAAEFAVPVQAEIVQALQSYQTDFYRSITQRIERLKLMLKSFDVNNMEVKFRTIEQPLLNRLEKAKENLVKNMNDKLKDTKVKIQQSVQILEGASPHTILQHGYSMVRTKDGTIVRNAQDVRTGAELEIIPAHGTIRAQVTECL
ncbi:MAG: exodeoxyribonuclease VII large subunit [Treponema sp.]|nr:exodeoxyribonuclease VII large subunit [Treponema sp.]